MIHLSMNASCMTSAFHLAAVDDSRNDVYERSGVNTVLPADFPYFNLTSWEFALSRGAELRDTRNTCGAQLKVLRSWR